MRRLHILAVIAAGLLCGCVRHESETSQVDALYVQRLNGRLAQYNATAAQLDADLKGRSAVPATQAAQTVGSGSPSPPDATAVQGEIFRWGEYHARAYILTRFMHEAAVSGQFGLMSSWIENVSTEVLAQGKETDGATAAFQQRVKTNLLDPQLPMQFVTLLAERGANQGAAEEIIAINNDVRGYEQDFKGASADDQRRREEANRLLTAYLSAPRVTVQAPPTMPMPAIPLPAMQLSAPPSFPRTTSCFPTAFGGMQCNTTP